MTLERGQRVRIPHRPDLPGHVKIDMANQVGDGWVLFVEQPGGSFAKVELTATQAASCEVLTEDGAGDSAALLAGLWTAWMRAAGSGARSAVLASTPLRPYAHQMNAVYGAMLPQPRLRFLLADEPGTGKTIMAGLYLREMQRLGFVRRALIVVPAHLVTKWQADFERFFGGGLRAITAQTIREHGLESDHDLWIVSLDLLSVNGLVQDAVHPDRMGWDAVVFDEAHRLTPTAVGYYQTGQMLALNTPRALLMTATPHRGKEWLFRALLHLVDPEVYPPVESNKEPSRSVKPGRVHFLRRMKEDLVDSDGVTKLFKGRHAENQSVALSPVEAEFYNEALDLVDRYFPGIAVPLGKMVYGKRAASSLYALAETLKRRRDGMGTVMPSAAAHDADPDGDDGPKADEARVVHEGSKFAKAERREIDALLKRLEPLVADLNLPVSKWDPLALTCLGRNGVKPGNGEQAVVFTEYADTADWLVQKLLHAGYTARRYSGRDNHHTRDGTRDAFARRDFQILVSTDAGNEGIDLQTAHVLVNYDIPWSLVRLEQRMGRIHRVGQTRDVELYNLIATDTREGEVLEVLLGNFVTAANQLDGRMFDSLSLVGNSSASRTTTSAASSLTRSGTTSSAPAPSPPSARSPLPGSRTPPSAPTPRNAPSRPASTSPRPSPPYRTNNSTGSTPPSSRRSCTARPPAAPSPYGRTPPATACSRSRAPTDSRCRRSSHPPANAGPERPRSSPAAAGPSRRHGPVARPSQTPSISDPATRRTRPSSRCARTPSRRLCTGAAHSSTRPAALTTTCSPTKRTSPRPADVARAPGPAWSASTAPERERLSGRCSRTSRPATPPPASRIRAGRTMPTSARRWPPTRTRRDGRPPSTTGSGSPATNSESSRTTSPTRSPTATHAALSVLASGP